MVATVQKRMTERQVWLKSLDVSDNVLIKCDDGATLGKGIVIGIGREIVVRDSDGFSRSFSSREGVDADSRDAIVPAAYIKSEAYVFA